MEEQRTSAAWLAAAMLLAVSLVTAYVAGYFMRGTYIGLDSSFGKRIYRSDWEASLFKPASRIESRVTGCSIQISTVERRNSTR